MISGEAVLLCALYSKPLVCGAPGIFSMRSVGTNLARPFNAGKSEPVTRVA